MRPDDHPGADDALAADGKAEERQYREYLSDAPRRQPGGSAGRMPMDF